MKCEICGLKNGKKFFLSGKDVVLCVWHQKKYCVGRFRPLPSEQFVLSIEGYLSDEITQRMKQEKVSDRNMMINDLILKGLGSVSREVK